MYICYQTWTSQTKSNSKEDNYKKSPQVFYKHLTIHIVIAIFTILFALFMFLSSKCSWEFADLAVIFFSVLGVVVVVVVCSCHWFALIMCQCVETLTVEWYVQTIYSIRVNFLACFYIVFFCAQFNWNLIRSKTSHWRKEKNGNKTTRRKKLVKKHKV